MGNLKDLFKYKKQIEIKDPNTDEVVEKPWIRVLGDFDLKEAYKWARVASSQKRANLRDVNSIEHKDEIAQLDGVPKENLVAIILAARETDIANEASVVVVREELPKLEDITSRPDAPSLEDQERLDRLTQEIDESYRAKIQDYVDTKLTEAGSKLMDLSIEEVLELAKSDLANVQALEAFVNELNDQKAFRGTYDDKECKIRSFDSVEEFKDSDSLLKIQIITEYNKLEMGPEEVKK